MIKFLSDDKPFPTFAEAGSRLRLYCLLCVKCIPLLLVLNVLFLIGCAPIVTIPISAGALQYALLKLVDGDTRVVHHFFKGVLKMVTLYVKAVVVYYAGVALFAYAFAFYMYAGLNGGAGWRIIVCVYGLFLLQLILLSFFWFQEFFTTNHTRTVIKNCILLLTSNFLPCFAVFILTFGLLSLTMQYPFLMLIVSSLLFSASALALAIIYKSGRARLVETGRIT